MSEQLTIEQRVANGAAELDRIVPGWPAHIVLSELRMDDSCACILGQTFGDYEDAQIGDERENARLGFQSYAVADVFPGGFIEPGSDRAVARDEEYAELKAEWTRVISARRETAEDLKARSRAVTDA